MRELSFILLRFRLNRQDYDLALFFADCAEAPHEVPGGEAQILAFFRGFGLWSKLGEGGRSRNQK